MGLNFSRKIIDPLNRNLDMKELLKKYKVEVSDWYTNDNNQLICNEVTYLNKDILNIDYKEMYKLMDELGLKGIDEQNKIYSYFCILL